MRVNRIEKIGMCVGFVTFAVLICVMLFAVYSNDMVYAAEELSPKYRLEVRIVYNAISDKEVAKRITEFARHGNPSCEFEMKVKKLGDNSGLVDSSGWSDLDRSGSYVIYFSTGGTDIDTKGD